MSGALDLLEVEARARRTGVHGAHEVGFADTAGARRLHEQPALRDQRDRERGQALVGGDRPRDLRRVLRERRRVDDHDVEATPCGAQALQLGERIAGEHLVRARGDGRQRAVERHVALRRRDGERARVDGQHGVRAAGGRVDGEPAGAAEDVEHAGAAGERADAAAVVALVEEVPGLLAANDVGLEREPRLEERHGPLDRLACDELALLQPVQVLVAGRAREAQHDRGRPAQVDERVDHVAQVRHPRRRVQLHDEHVRVAIDDEAGQAVVLAVDEPVAGGRRIELGRERRPSLDRRAEPRPEPCRVDRHRRALVEHLHADGRRRVPQPDRDEAAVVVEHDGEVAGRALAGGAADRAVVQPRVTGLQAPASIGRHAQRDALRRRGGQVVEARRHGPILP